MLIRGKISNFLGDTTAGTEGPLARLIRVRFTPPLGSRLYRRGLVTGPMGSNSVPLQRRHIPLFNSRAIVYLAVLVDSTPHNLFSEVSLASILRYRDAPGYVNALSSVIACTINSDRPYPCRHPFATAKCVVAEPLKVEAMDRPLHAS
jgi:hypothetical protein